MVSRLRPSEPKFILSSWLASQPKGSTRTMWGMSARRISRHPSLDFARDERRGGSGFTLIEMMVALAVFALAALALIRLEGATIRGAGILDSALVGQIVARNAAIEAVTDAKPPALGLSSGTEQNGGKTWRWTRTVAPTGDQRILRIDVSVIDGDGRPAGKLTMIRAASAS
jgi:general secretion pathway protein I